MRSTVCSRMPQRRLQSRRRILRNIPELLPRQTEIVPPWKIVSLWWHPRYRPLTKTAERRIPSCHRRLHGCGAILTTSSHRLALNHRQVSNPWVTSASLLFLPLAFARHVRYRFPAMALSRIPHIVGSTARPVCQSSHLIRVVGTGLPW